jgi:lysophospholipid acyltransferase (LPLAT)-like uncharacterized protein
MALKQFKQSVLRLIGNFTLNFGVNALCKTLRVSFVNKRVIDELEAQSKNYILAFWHGTMILPWYLNRNKKFAALISKSKDGELLGRLLRQWNYNVIRGSSSSGGDVALGIMIDFAKNKSSIAITPDGPRGPEFKLKAGAVIAAKKSGLPLVLLGIGYKNKRVLKNWDHFQIPYFFSRANAVFSDLIYVDSKLSYDETSKVIENCETQLSRLQTEAEKFN